MHLLICTSEEDAPHVRALLNRFAIWGMLRYYDMDKVFESLEEWKVRLLTVFTDELMDWKTFVDFLEELPNIPNDPMKGLHTLAFYFPESNQLLDYTHFQNQVRQHGRPA